MAVPNPGQLQPWPPQRPGRAAPVLPDPRAAPLGAACHRLGTGSSQRHWHLSQASNCTPQLAQTDRATQAGQPGALRSRGGRGKPTDLRQDEIHFSFGYLGGLGKSRLCPRKASWAVWLTPAHAAPKARVSLPFRFIPIWRHLSSRQYWHLLRCLRDMTQFLSRLHL